MAVGPARKGSRVVLEPNVPKDRPRTTDVYVTCARGLRMGTNWLHEGVEVPGAASWPRIEAWVNARRIRKAAPGEKIIAFSEFEAQQAEKEQVNVLVEAEVERSEV